MLQRFVPRVFHTRLLLVLALLGALTWIALTFFRRPAPVVNPGARPSNLPTLVTGAGDASRKLEGDAARNFLQSTSQGESLMKMIETQQYGLKSQEQSPFDKASGAGYLGMSHDENLNVWFGDEGATIRPTLSQKDRDKAWTLGLTLKSYGYGDQLIAPPPIVSHSVKDSRIEYQRSQSAIDNRQPAMIEWYVNKSTGIEQGFTLNERPTGVNGEALRLVLSVTGGLQAQATADGQSVELMKSGEAVLTYDHLVATDASGRKLAARMETNSVGNDISLIVDDANAQYPIVVDPIAATLKQKLTSPAPQQDARFGFAVALSGFTMAVGAWREDVAGTPDVGAVYVFSKSQFTLDWIFLRRFGSASTSQSEQCGWSIAISLDRIVYGCPGANNLAGIRTGTAFTSLRTGENSFNTTALEVDVRDPTYDALRANDRFGSSVAVSGNRILVGAPDRDEPFFGLTKSGAAFFFNLAYETKGYQLVGGSSSGAQAGTSVAIDSDVIVVGLPGQTASGQAYVLRELDQRTFAPISILNASDGSTGDQFGQSVAISANTIVVGAPEYNNGAEIDVGAAYVFQRFGDQLVLQQQKLLPSDGAAGDHFSENALAIQGNTIVIGAYGNGIGADPFIGKPDDDRGAAYIFTRKINTWTQETKIQLSNFAGGEAGAHFGIDVDISGTIVLIGARAASAGTTPTAGAAFVYQLDCVAPFNVRAVANPDLIINATNNSTPHGGRVTFLSQFSNLGGTTPSFQWRKNGVNIPGATGDRYIIESACSSDVATYDVIVTNGCGSVLSTPATFTLTGRFELQPGNKTVCESGIVNWPNSEVRIWQTSVGQSTYQWRRKGVNLGVANLIPTGSSDFGIGMSLFPVRASDGGTYDVMITDACTTELSNPATLTVLSNSISANSQSFTASGGTGAVAVTACMAGGEWSTRSNDSWITITSPTTQSVNGNGNVIYSVAANSGPARTGTMSIAGKTFTVSQDGSVATPTIFVETGNTNQAVALDSVTFVRGPFRTRTFFNFSSDGQTRVILFTTSLGLTQTDVSKVSVSAAGVVLPVENVGPVTGVAGLIASYIIVRLPNGLPSGNLPLIVIANGVQCSNSPTLGISP